MRSLRWLRFTPALLIALSAPACAILAGLDDYHLASTSSGGHGGSGAGGAQPAGPSTLSLGMRHACAVRLDGALRCWGDNTYGQLGLASDEALRGTPTGVPDLGVVKRVTAGAGHTCAITELDEVACWGDNSNGAAGSTEIGAIVTPRSLGFEAAEIAAGNDFTCAIVLEDGDRRVKCWGDNSSGSLGRSGSMSPIPKPTSPEITGATAIVTCPTCRTACAIEGARALCWGGDVSLAAPIDVGVDDVRALALGSAGVAGAEVLFLLDGNGAVKTTQRAADGSFEEAADYADGVTAIAAGDHVCALMNDGTGRCSEPIESSAPTPPLLDDVAHATPFESSEIRVGDGFACAVSMGTLSCAGVNDWGQLGDGKPRRVTRPVKVASGVDRVIAGTNCVSVQQDVTLSAFGLCQVYAGETWYLPTLVPESVVPGYAARFFTGPPVGDIGSSSEDRRGYFHDGLELYSLRDGVKDTTLLGAFDPTTIERIVLTEQWDAVKTDDGKVHIVAVADHVLAHGIFDNAAAVAKGTIYEVPVGVAGFAAASWAPHICVHPTAGAPHCWGDNSNAQSDPMGSLDNFTTYSGTKAVPIGGDVVEMAVGERHTCAIRKNDLKVVCWGSDDLGQLGGASAGVGSTGTKIPTLPFGYQASHLAAGRDFTCAMVHSDQEIYCWGNGAFGAGGNGKLLSPLPPTRVDLPEQTVVQIAATAGSVCARTQSNDVHCWGDSPFGQVGNGSRAQRSDWQPVAF